MVHPNDTFSYAFFVLLQFEHFEGSAGTKTTGSLDCLKGTHGLLKIILCDFYIGFYAFKNKAYFKKKIVCLMSVHVIFIAMLLHRKVTLSVAWNIKR